MKKTFRIITDSGLRYTVEEDAAVADAVTFVSNRFYKSASSIPFITVPDGLVNLNHVVAIECVNY